MKCRNNGGLNVAGNNLSVNANSINANSSIINVDSSKSADPYATEEQMLYKVLQFEP